MDFIGYVKEDKGLFALSVMRIIVGLMLLWGFFDKLFGVGYETPAGQGMIDGGSPSSFVKYFDGPFSGLFQPLAGNMAVDVLLMAALLLIGMALILGIGMKIATIAGMLFMFMMYLLTFPPKDNPLLDYHLVYIFVLLAAYYYHTEDRYGLGKKWKQIPFVEEHPILW